MLAFQTKNYEQGKHGFTSIFDILGKTNQSKSTNTLVSFELDPLSVSLVLTNLYFFVLKPTLLLPALLLLLVNIDFEIDCSFSRDIPSAVSFFFSFLSIESNILVFFSTWESSIAKDVAAWVFCFEDTDWTLVKSVMFLLIILVWPLVSSFLTLLSLSIALGCSIDSSNFRLGFKSDTAGPTYKVNRCYKTNWFENENSSTAIN